MDHSLLINNPLFRENVESSHMKNSSMVTGWEEADLSPVPSDSPKPEIGNTVWVTWGRGTAMQKGMGRNPGFAKLNLGAKAQWKLALFCLAFYVLFQ